MAVAFDNSSGKYLAVAGSGTGSLPTFAVSSSNPTIIVFVFAAILNAEGDPTVTANGTSMTKLVSTTPASNDRILIFSITGQSGANTAIVLTNSSGSARDYRVIALSYTGTNQTPVYSGGGQTDAFFASATLSAGTSITHSLTTITDNSWVVTAGVDDNDTNQPTAGTNVTFRNDSQVSSLMSAGDSNGVVHPAGGLSQTWNASPSAPLGIMQISVSPAPVVAANGNFLAFM